MASILLADDEETVRNLFEMVLDSVGHTVTCVSNGEQVLAALSEGSFDLIVSDNNMRSKKDGVVVLDELRNEGNMIPFILLSGYALLEDGTLLTDLCEVRGAYFFQKPVKNKVLLEAVANALAKAGK